MTPKIDMRAAWNRTSAGYQRLHQIPTDAAHYGPWAPDESELRLLGDVRGKRILEIGCGGGQCSIAFARQGAIAVGIDLSDEQLAFASQLAQSALAPGVANDDALVPPTFLQGDASDLGRFTDGSFDLVFSAYALHYVPHIEACLAEVSRVLRRADTASGRAWPGNLSLAWTTPSAIVSGTTTTVKRACNRCAATSRVVRWIGSLDRAASGCAPSIAPSAIGSLCCTMPICRSSAFSSPSPFSPPRSKRAGRRATISKLPS